MAKEVTSDMNRREIRMLGVDDIELRVEDDSKITGYAAKFNAWSEDLGGFREKIKPGAFDGALGDDVRALKNHDSNQLLGRTKSGTLRLEATSTGLRFEVDVPNTSVGRDTVEEIRRGDLSGCSFAFTVEEDDWKYKDDDTIERTIVKVGRLYDVGPVCYPAYPDTTVAARSLDAFKDSLKKEELESRDNSEEADVEEGGDTTVELTEEELRQQEIDERKRQLEIERGMREAGWLIQRQKAKLADAGS